MKNLSFIFVLIFTMFSCNKDNISYDKYGNLENEVSSRIIPIISVPNKVIDNINHKWYTFPFKMRSNIYKQYGDIDYGNGIKVKTDSSFLGEIFTIPFEKDGLITGMMVYIDDQSTERTLYDFITLERILNNPITSWDNFYKTGLLKFYIRQFMQLQYLKNGTVSNELLLKLEEYEDNVRENKISPRCITIINSYYIIDVDYYGEVFEEDYGEHTTISIEYEVIKFDCHGEDNVNGFPLTVPSGSNLPTLSSSELRECLRTQVTPIFEGFIDEWVEEIAKSSVVFPCVNKYNLDDKWEDIKNQILYNWCAKNKDNKGKKLNFNELSQEFDNVLKDENYVDLDEVPVHKSDCSKTDEQNLADFNKYMQDNGGCTESGFQNALESYLGIGKTKDPTKPSLSINKFICGDVFNVTPHVSKPNTFVTGISSIQFTFSVPGSNLPLNITFANLYFENNATNCQFSFSTAVSNSINSAVATMQAQINAGGKLNRVDLYKMIFRAYQKELEHCTPHHGTTVGSVSLLSDGSPNCGGADYAVLDNDDCP